MTDEHKYVPGTKILKPKVPLVGEDGNAYSIMGRIARGLKKVGCTKEIIDEYIKKSKSGDYDNLLRVALEYCEDVGREPEEYEVEDS